jgi:hypothetical protein
LKRSEGNGPRARRVSVKRHPGVYFREGADGRRRYEITYRDSTGKRRWETVDGNLDDADAALARARDAVTNEGRQALVNVICPY